jgi:hypothetical protein
MASPNAVFTELVTTTFRKHGKVFKDNYTKNNALLRRIMKNKMKKVEDGGLSIVVPLEYAANGTYQRFSGYDILNIAASDVLAAAEFQWRNIAINVVASGEELRKNSGESRIISLAKARLKNAMNTFKNNFSFDVYSDGTMSNQVNGLQALIADAGTGTVGGIDSGAAGNEFWRNKVQSAAAPIAGGGAVTVGATTIEKLMRDLWLSLVRGDDKTNLIVADNNYFSFYEDSQVSLKRYTNESDADGGFDTLKYKGADVIFDGGSGIPSNRMYFMNDNYIGMTTHKDADLTVLDEMRPYNQDAAVIPILWMGNLTVANRSLQGVFKP